MYWDTRRRLRRTSFSAANIRQTLSSVTTCWDSVQTVIAWRRKLALKQLDYFPDPFYFMPWRLRRRGRGNQRVSLQKCANITGTNPEAILMVGDHYDHPLCPGLQPGPPSQTPGGLGQRYWSVSVVTWPPKPEYLCWVRLHNTIENLSIFIVTSSHAEYWQGFISEFCTHFLKEQSLGKIHSYVSYGLNHWFKKLHQFEFTAILLKQIRAEPKIFLCWSNKENQMSRQSLRDLQNIQPWKLFYE